MALPHAKLGVSLFRHPCRKPLSPRERLCMLGWLCIVQSLWAYTPGIRAGAECGAAALTKQGRLQSVAHSRCTMQRHQRLTNRIGATPQTPFSKIILVYRQSKLCLFQAQFLFFAKKLLTIVRNRIIISLSPISDLTICRQGESAWIIKTTEKNCMNIIMY